MAGPAKLVNAGSQRIRTRLRPTTGTIRTPEQRVRLPTAGRFHFGTIRGQPARTNVMQQHEGQQGFLTGCRRGAVPQKRRAGGQSGRPTGCKAFVPECPAGIPQAVSGIDFGLYLLAAQLPAVRRTWQWPSASRSTPARGTPARV